VILPSNVNALIVLPITEHGCIKSLLNLVSEILQDRPRMKKVRNVIASDFFSYIMEILFTNEIPKHT